eukprot:NODE_4295_length_1908_cov_27.651881.p1 GENE.NODE_4295_length_1908_cov_27.651881~~NODE_4295_length_1908_cov_27.651881.p1  ORF type:complete len:556 (+),score=164.06 NODE_4295_length_1908_cov_27.651881:203-1669(+)
MVLCSGLGPDAQETLATGIGALAGSTIMLLTLPWLLAVWTGRVNIEGGKPTYKKPDNAPENWDKLMPPGHANIFTTGVAIGSAVKANAKIMLITSVTFLVIQFPAISVDNNKPEKIPAKAEVAYENPFAWIGLVMCILFFICYIGKMVKDSSNSKVLDSQIVETTVAGIKNGRITIQGVMADMSTTGLADTRGPSDGNDEPLLKRQPEMTPEGKRLHIILAQFFTKYDKDGNNTISLDEFRILLLDVGVGGAQGEEQERIFRKFTRTESMDFGSFVNCIGQLALEVRESDKPAKAKTPATYIEDTNADEDEADEEEVPEDLANLSPEEQRKRILKRALFSMSFGTVLVLLFSDPMCDMLTVMGSKLKVSPFYISFVLAPLASNASELIAAMRLASKKSKSSMVNAFCSLEGAAIMNNTFCLGIFMFLIIFKSLAWKFAAETVAILAVQVVVGFMAHLPTQTVFQAIIIFLCYPLSLVLVIMLEAVGYD